MSMAASRGPRTRRCPTEFLDWQVELRLWTMEQRNGAPHAGVAPLVVVRRRASAPASTAHSIICGLLPRPDAARGEDRGVPRALRGAARRGRARGLRPRHRVPEELLRTRREPSTRRASRRSSDGRAGGARAARRAALRARLLRLRPARAQRGRQASAASSSSCRAEVLALGPGLRQRLVAQHAVPRHARATTSWCTSGTAELGHALRRPRGSALTLSTRKHSRAKAPRRRPPRHLCRRLPTAARRTPPRCSVSCVLAKRCFANTKSMLTTRCGAASAARPERATWRRRSAPFARPGSSSGRASSHVVRQAECRVTPPQRVVSVLCTLVKRSFAKVTETEQRGRHPALGRRSAVTPLRPRRRHRRAQNL